MQAGKHSRLQREHNFQDCMAVNILLRKYLLLLTRKGLRENVKLQIGVGKKVENQLEEIHLKSAIFVHCV